MITSYYRHDSPSSRYLTKEIINGTCKGGKVQVSSFIDKSTGKTMEKMVIYRKDGECKISLKHRNLETDKFEKGPMDMSKYPY